MLKPLWNSLSRTCRGRKRGQECPVTSLPGAAWWKEASQCKLPPPVEISTLITEVPVGQTQEGQKWPGPRAR